MFGLPLLLLAGGAGYWLLSGGSVSTDNAYVQLVTVSVAAQFGGLFTDVSVPLGHQFSKCHLLFLLVLLPSSLSFSQSNSAFHSSSFFFFYLSSLPSPSTFFLS